MKKVLLGASLLFLLFGCYKEEPEVYVNNYYYNTDNLGTVMDGTVIIENVDLKGSQQINAEATAIFAGKVTLDGLAVIGEAYIADSAVVYIDGPLQVSGGAKLTVDGHLVAESFAQIGDVYVRNGSITITNKYQVSGGTTLYLENAHIQADQFVLIGSVQALENENTLKGNIFSVIESIGIEYIHRSGGTSVCGPVVFTNNFDHNGNGSGESFVDRTSNTLTIQPHFYHIYELDSIKLYQFTDQLKCKPLKEAK